MIEQKGYQWASRGREFIRQEGIALSSSSASLPSRPHTNADGWNVKKFPVFAFLYNFLILKAFRNFFPLSIHYSCYPDTHSMPGKASSSCPSHLLIIDFIKSKHASLFLLFYSKLKRAFFMMKTRCEWNTKYTAAAAKFGIFHSVDWSGCSYKSKFIFPISLKPNRKEKQMEWISLQFLISFCIPLHRKYKSV